MSTQRARRVRPTVPTARPRLWAAILASGTGLTVLAVLVAIQMGAAPSDPSGTTSLPAAATVAAEGEDAEAVDVDDDLVPLALPLVAYELLLARDPFEPVVPEPEPEPTAPTDPTDPTDPSTPDDPAEPGANSDPSTIGNGAIGDAAAPPSCTRGAEVVCDGRVLTVTEILEENGEMVAVIQVDTMRWRVTSGDIFADVFQVLSISPNEVRVLYGDRIVTILVRDNALK